MTTPLTDPVLRRVAAANPASVTDLTEVESVRAEALLARIEATPRGHASSPAPARRRVRRLPGTFRSRLVAAAATAVAVAATAILAPSTASAEAVLLQAADAAALQPQATGAYWYVHRVVRDVDALSPDDPDAKPFEFEREIWLGRDGGILRDGAAAAMNALSTGQAGEVRTESLDFDGPTLFGEGANLTWDEVMALPTDPTALREAILSRTVESGHGDSWDLYDTLSALLIESPAPPLVRRAMWTVLSGLSEFRDLGPTTDALGRPGTLVAADFSGQRLGVYQYVIDPTDGTVIETRSLGPDNETVLSSSTLVEQGPRDSAPAAQPPLCGPGSVPLVSC